MTDYEKFKSIVDEIDDLVAHQVVASAPAFEGWQAKTERFLVKKYGNDSLDAQTLTLQLTRQAEGTPEAEMEDLALTLSFIGGAGGTGTGSDGTWTGGHRGA